ncbi:MAG: methyltransferase domain-containing protein [Pseudomonadota bacterium]|nr:methyltransferase domain-containing protein [Pseudomonadota bacterium]
MNDDGASVEHDQWSEWLLHRRHGGDSSVIDAMQVQIAKYTDRVLDGAGLAPGMTLLDIGAGEGLVSFQAIERIGPSLRVMLTDISVPMLAHAAKLAKQRGVDSQCRFLACAADNLAGIDDESVDVVVTRAVLAYVDDKAGALREFYRVLKPGGRLSICEPIMRDDAVLVYAMKALLAVPSPESSNRLFRLQHSIRSAQFPDTPEKIAQHPCTNFTERDLVHLAQGAGYQDVHMEFHIDVQSVTQTSWQAFLESSPHPLAPSVRQIITDDFDASDRDYFIAQYRPVIEAGNTPGTTRTAFLTARKEAH